MYSRELGVMDPNVLLRDEAFNKHSLNDGEHMSPYDNDRVDVGLDNLVVRLVQGIDEESFKRTLSKAQRATIGIPVSDDGDVSDWEEMMRGGLQTALESQTVIFEVIGVARATTHQLVRSRRAAFHQQSMRASYFGDHPNFRMPESIWRLGQWSDPAALESRAFAAWERSIELAHEAYRLACQAGTSYQDARYILPIGTETYIMCEYPVREFLAVYAYRACSMFQWEISHTVRQMGELLKEAHPWIAPYVKISCQDKTCQECGGAGSYWTEWSDRADRDPARAALVLHRPTEPDGTVLIRCSQCGGLGKTGSRCTFQGWEDVELGCDFPQAKHELRTFQPTVHRIQSVGRRQGKNAMPPSEVPGECVSHLCRLRDHTHAVGEEGCSYERDADGLIVTKEA